MWYGFGDYGFLFFYSVVGGAVPLVIKWAWKTRMKEKFL